MKKDTEETERLGIYHCATLFTKLGFIFREQPIADYGIDAIIENKDENYATGKLIAVQIKSGTSFFKESSENRVIYRGESKHYNYWINHSLPVIIVLFNPETNECIWEVINKKTAIECNKGWKIEIPKENALENSANQLLKILNEQNEFERRWNSLVLAKPWMIETKKSGELILEVTEWINKSSGRGHFKLMNREELVLYDSEMFGFGCRGYDQVIPDLFPWAEITIDEDFYKEEMDQEWFIQREEAEADFAYRVMMGGGAAPKRNCQIFPYANGAGEVDYYRLILRLNSIGEAFIEMEDFLENGHLYYIDNLNL